MSLNVGPQCPRVVAMLDLLSRWVSCGATKKVKRCMYFTSVCGWLYESTLIDQTLMSVALVSRLGAFLFGEQCDERLEAPSYW